MSEYVVDVDRERARAHEVAESLRTAAESLEAEAQALRESADNIEAAWEKHWDG